jgi:ribonuclease H / adenosylcobalamin/alpha-ribazole phosphatase
MGNLILVRHGESSGNRERIFATDPQALPLTELGYAQARAAAHCISALFHAKLVVASPFLRAQETARVIAAVLAAPLQIEPDLYERDVGIYRGQSYDSLVAAPDYVADRPWVWRPDGGESYEDVKARVAPVLDRLAEENPDNDVVVVSHGGVMMTLWAYVAGGWDAAHAPPNCGIVQVEHGPQGYLSPKVIGAVGVAQDAGG